MHVADSQAGHRVLSGCPVVQPPIHLASPFQQLPDGPSAMGEKYCKFQVGFTYTMHNTWFLDGLEHTENGGMLVIFNVVNLTQCYLGWARASELEI